MDTSFSVTIHMSDDSVQTLAAGGFRLCGFRAVKGPPGALPVLWFLGDSYSETTSVEWTDVYEAYTSHTAFTPGTNTNVATPGGAQASTGTESGTSASTSAGPGTGTQTSIGTSKPTDHPASTQAGASTNTKVATPAGTQASTGTGTSTTASTQGSTGTGTTADAPAGAQGSTGTSTEPGTPPGTQGSTGTSTESGTSPSAQAETGTSTAPGTPAGAQGSTGTSTTADTRTSAGTNPGTGTVIDPAFSYPVQLGQALQVTGADLSGEVVEVGGTPGAVAIINTTPAPFTCGIALLQPGGGSIPICAFPMLPNGDDLIVPLDTVFLMFSPLAEQEGELVERSFSAGLLIDMTDASSRSVTYDATTGVWSWADQAAWATPYPPNQELAPLLVLPLA
ncbi:MAG TPA: hypothetical protein VHG93_18360 [Longimicrobium sp.]|nr:hypothetical protein [Longimicrobium sp.]